MKIAVIPARGGSKRIPRKNIKLFRGEPIISYSIKAALNTGIFQKIIVSTDDPEIQAIAIRYGAESPFLRPSHLADDVTGTASVVRHTAEFVIDTFGDVEHVCTIYPTAPLLRPQFILEAFARLIETGAHMCIPVVPFESAIQRAIRFDDEGRLSMFHPENYLTRTQDLVPAFHDAGQFYWATAESIINNFEPFTKSSVGYVLPKMYAKDVDTLEDWANVELAYEILKDKLI